MHNLLKHIKLPKFSFSMRMNYLREYVSIIVSRSFYSIENEDFLVTFPWNILAPLCYCVIFYMIFMQIVLELSEIRRLQNIKESVKQLLILGQAYQICSETFILAINPGTQVSQTLNLTQIHLLMNQVSSFLSIYLLTQLFIYSGSMENTFYPKYHNRNHKQLKSRIFSTYMQGAYDLVCLQKTNGKEVKQVY